MKELSSIEQKAKAYDGLIERLKDLKFAYRFSPLSDTIEEKFPELKESEDEKIRKEILLFCRDRKEKYYNDQKYANIDAWIAYLERKGTEREKEGNSLLPVEQKISLSLPTEGEFPYNNPADTLDGEIENIWKKLSCDNKFTATKNGFHEVVVHFVNWYEKQGEKKPTDKVEPKFKVGDIITNGKIIGKVDENENNKYHGHFCYNKGMSEHYADIPDIENWHKWTISDAKPGDVLVASDNSVFVFNKCDELCVNFLVALTKDGHMQISDGKHHWEVANHCIPATKKQCALLFQKIHDAGYKWDAEKLELKQTKNVFPLTEDREMLESIINDVKQRADLESEQIDWLVSLREKFDCIS